jgi:hypothetical protein
VGECPNGALTIEERAAEEFDLDAARAHVLQSGGEEALQRLESSAAAHGLAAGSALPVVHGHAPGAAPGGGCPGSRARWVSPPEGPDAAADGPVPAARSELRQWPVQLHLVRPDAPYFRDRELVVMSTCGPLAGADVHPRFLRDKSVVVACPKLDDTTPYVGKLAAILRRNPIPRVTVVRMEVPCCGGLTEITRRAVRESGRADLCLDEAVLAVNGELTSVTRAEESR